MSNQDDIRNQIKDQLQAFSVNNYIYQSGVATAFGLHTTDMLAIHHLHQKDDMTAGQLGRALGLTSGATTALIDRLIRLGFVKREPHPNDRRRIYIRLHTSKIKALKANYQAIDRRVEDILAAYSDREAQVIAQFLQALSEAAPPQEE